MQIIKKKFKEVYELCVEECADLQEVNETQKEKLKRLYGFTPKGEIHYNPYNLILFDRDDAAFFINILPQGSCMMQMNVSEYGVYMFVIRYSFDGVLSEILV